MWSYILYHNTVGTIGLFFIYMNSLNHILHDLPMEDQFIELKALYLSFLHSVNLGSILRLKD